MPEQGGYEPGNDHNRLICCDLIISGLCGVRIEKKQRLDFRTEKVLSRCFISVKNNYRKQNINFFIKTLDFLVFVMYNNRVDVRNALKTVILHFIKIRLFCPEFCLNFKFCQNCGFSI